MMCLCRKEPKSTIDALFFCEKIWEVWWYWQTCPISLLAEKHDLIDFAMHILQVGTSHDLEVLFTTAWSVRYKGVKWIGLGGFGVGIIGLGI